MPEPLRRTNAQTIRDTLIHFAAYTHPTYSAMKHHARLARALEWAERTPNARLLVSMPPRHGKSELCSVRFPAWYLGRNPNRPVILAAYTADLAERFSRQVRAVVTSEAYASIFPGVTIAQDSRAVGNWSLSAPHRGGLKAVGVGGPLTGFGAGLLIIDDPVKNRAEADSETYRNAVWDWYTSTAYTRLEDGGAVVVVMTRWHEDDLAGRLLVRMADGTGDTWRVLVMPAVSDEGHALWPEKYTLADLERIRSAIGEYDWSALYQGAPTPREGARFRVGLIDVIDATPAGCTFCRGWDLAATVKGDYTAGVLMGRLPDGRFVIADVVHGNWEPNERNATTVQTVRLDGRTVRQVLPQDPGQAGVDQRLALARMLAGFDVRFERPTGSKETRADPFCAQVNAGNVMMVRGEWNRRFIDELRQFPLGAHDDQVDAAATAFNALAAKRELTFL